MNATPEVSVVMPVHNGAEYLREAVDSILAQTLTDLELIAIDDGSTDTSNAILKNYALADKRIRVICQDNAGIATALNRGISEARGAYIARMDADDICAPDRLARQVKFMNTRPTTGLCGTGWSFIGRRKGSVVPVTDDAGIRAAQLFRPSIAHPTAMIRRDLITKYDLWYNTELKQAEDYELWLRLSRHAKMANLPESLLSYRVTDSQATSRCESEVSEWSSVAHRQAIERLGIEPTDEELRLHRFLAGNTAPKSLERVKNAEAWLLKLLDANEKTHAYDKAAFRRVIFERWHSFCSRAAEKGLWAWPTFKKSRLSEGVDLPAHYGASFFARYVLRDRTRAVYYRLLRFDGVWKVVTAFSPRSKDASREAN